MLQGIERNGAVHCARIDENIAEACCYGLGKGTLAARRVSVDGNNYLSIVGHGLLKVDDY